MLHQRIDYKICIAIGSYSDVWPMYGIWIATTAHVKNLSKKREFDGLCKFSFQLI